MKHIHETVNADEKGVIFAMQKIRVRWQLLIYDLVICLAVQTFLLVVYKGNVALSAREIAIHMASFITVVFGSRLLGNIYGQIWRYGGTQCYVRLVAADTASFFIAALLALVLPIGNISLARTVAIYSTNLLGALSLRMFYRYAYLYGNSETALGRLLKTLLMVFAGPRIECENNDDQRKIRIAIIGAGRAGSALAHDLDYSPAAYKPVCFVDVKKEKAGREIQGVPVIMADENVLQNLKSFKVQEVVFAIPDMPDAEKKRIYDFYLKSEFKLKVYDHSVIQSAVGKRHMREFDIEELLFRTPVVISNERTVSYYQGKVIMITGGGGSIGSELCRQLAKMSPEKIVILDIYENGAYDVQQELKIAYGNKLDVCIEIASVTNRRSMARVFEKHNPDIVINAAAHKHVPLMEENCIEAVENNVFGTEVLIEMCEKFGTERFMMVSTDKAVNPTNVMGATKRMCEMMVQSASSYGKVKYSATRFGNVLGSAGSAVPLFKRQIAAGGPITLTDKRIIRYFMTIPEAAQLVLESGAMANNGELFVLDMGQPVKIYDLAQNMIRLSGANGIEIVETGLRPGEKLYEELLIQTEELTKTDNSLIYIEKDTHIDREAVQNGLEMLKAACMTESDDRVREVLKQVVPTYKSPEEVNSSADKAVKELTMV